MFDLFGFKARSVLYELGKAAAIRHVNAVQAYIDLNVGHDCPQTIEVPLSVLLEHRFVEKPGPEWDNNSFVKGFVDHMNACMGHDARLKRMKERDASHRHLRERGKFVPLVLVCVVVVIEQRKLAAMPAPTPTEPDNIVYLQARVARA